ncbi:MAG: radical SAM protein [bacterium]|nr:radical SAM protein [bacterium]
MMSAAELYEIEPFEICSIRPPTENYSLTFRLTRNCYWNKCKFCPVYKIGARFSKRTLEDVLRDIEKAKQIDDMLFEQGIGNPVSSDADFYRVPELIDKIKQAKWEAGIVDAEHEEETRDIPANLDPRMQWFLSWFKDKPVLEDSINHIISWRIGGAKTCFLGDADSLILKPAFLDTVMKKIKINFPSIERFTVYGRTRSAAQLRSVKELKAYRKSGLDRIHFGMESGSDRVLSLVEKGVTAAQHVEAGTKVREAGISCSVYVMPGLGGAELSGENAEETARVLTQAAPDYIRLRSLEIFPGTPLEEAIQRGTFTEATEEQVVREIRTLVESIETETEIASDSASNLLQVYGRLPHDRDAMLEVIDGYLSLEPRGKLEYSLQARLSSFMGQYGTVTEDILKALGPYIKDGSIDMALIPDRELEQATRLIRGKLMP